MNKPLFIHDTTQFRVEIHKSTVTKLINKRMGFKEFSLQEEIDLYLEKHDENKSNIFDPDKKNTRLKFPPELKSLCHHVFEMIANLEKKNKYYAALTASEFYGMFYSYWKKLLLDGKDLIGLSLWYELLRITKRWERQERQQGKSVNIHKGALYYSIAETYILLGNIDMAFFYLYQAFILDKDLGKVNRSIKYPLNAPSYTTITLSDNKENHMYPFIKKLRDRLSRFIDQYNRQYKKTFTMQNLDEKILSNKKFFELVIYFTSNLISLISLEKSISKFEANNAFIKLKIVDIIFNLCLVIEVILKTANLTIHNFIIHINNLNKWNTQTDLESFMGNKGLSINQ
ncbi:hypothetical protein [Candidatus Nitrosocosmicus sp. R]